MSSDSPVFLAEPLIEEDEVQAASDVLRSGWITSGPKVAEFEERFAALHEKQRAVAVGSCTAGLHLALAALNISSGDEVIVPSLTFVASVNSVRYVGAKPVLGDIAGVLEPHLSLEHAERLLTPKTRAVIVVHYGGYPVDLNQWRQFCDRHGLALVEDAAHAVGMNEVGTVSDFGVFSFFGNKNMTTAEGGMMVSPSNELLDRVSRLRSHGMTTSSLDRRKGHAFSYDVTDLGFNYRMDEIRAAIGLVQLSKVLGWNAYRRELQARYRKHIATACPAVSVPFGDRATTSAHLMAVLLPEGTDRSAVMSCMRDAGVHTSMHYPPAHGFTLYEHETHDVLPVTDAYCARELTLPLHPGLTEADIDRVVVSLADALGANT